MQGGIVKPLSSDLYDDRMEERLVNSADHQWPLGPAILMMAASTALLWIAVYFGAREFL